MKRMKMIGGEGRSGVQGSEFRVQGSELRVRKRCALCK
jgi:hypothetical protein